MGEETKLAHQVLALLQANPRVDRLLVIKIVRQYFRRRGVEKNVRGMIATKVVAQRLGLHRHSLKRIYRRMGITPTTYLNTGFITEAEYERVAGLSFQRRRKGERGKPRIEREFGVVGHAKQRYTRQETCAVLRVGHPTLIQLCSDVLGIRKGKKLLTREHVMALRRHLRRKRRPSPEKVIAKARKIYRSLLPCPTQPVVQPSQFHGDNQCSDCGGRKSPSAGRRCKACYQKLVQQRKNDRLRLRAAKEAAFKTVLRQTPPHVRSKVVLVANTPSLFDRERMKRSGCKANYLSPSERIEVALTEVAPKTESLFWSNGSRVVSYETPTTESGLTILQKLEDGNAVSPLDSLLEQEGVSRIIQRLINEKGMSPQDAQRLVRETL